MAGLSIFEVQIGLAKEECAKELGPFVLMRRVKRRQARKKKASYGAVVRRKLLLLDELRSATRVRSSRRRAYVAGREAAPRDRERAAAVERARAFEELSALPRDAARIALLLQSLTRNASRASAMSQGVLARAKAAAVAAKREEVEPVEKEGARVNGALRCHAVFEKRRAAFAKRLPQPMLGTAELNKVLEHQRAYDRARLEGRAMCKVCTGWLNRAAELRLVSSIVHGGQDIEVPAADLKDLVAPWLCKLRKELRTVVLAARGGASLVRNAAARHVQRSLSLAAALRSHRARLERRDASHREFLGRRFGKLRDDCRVFVGDDVERAANGEARRDVEEDLLARHAPWLRRRAVRACLWAFADRRRTFVLRLQREFRRRAARRQEILDARVDIDERENGRIDALRAAADAAHARQQKTRDAYRLPPRREPSRGSELSKQARYMLKASKPRRLGPPPSATPWAKPVGWARPVATPPKVRVLPTRSLFAPQREGHQAKILRKAHLARVSRSGKSVRFAPDELLHAPGKLSPLKTPKRPGTSGSGAFSARTNSSGGSWKALGSRGDARPMSGVSDVADDGRFAATPERRVGDVPLLGLDYSHRRGADDFYRRRS